LSQRFANGRGSWSMSRSVARDNRRGPRGAGLGGPKSQSLSCLCRAMPFGLIDFSVRYSGRKGHISAGSSGPNTPYPRSKRGNPHAYLCPSSPCLSEALGKRNLIHVTARRYALPHDPRRTWREAKPQFRPESDRSWCGKNAYYFNSQSVGGCFHNPHQLAANSLSAMARSDLNRANPHFTGIEMKTTVDKRAVLRIGCLPAHVEHPYLWQCSFDNEWIATIEPGKSTLEHLSGNVVDNVN